MEQQCQSEGSDEPERNRGHRVPQRVPQGDPEDGIVDQLPEVGETDVARRSDEIPLRERHRERPDRREEDQPEQRPR